MSYAYPPPHNAYYAHQPPQQQQQQPPPPPPPPPADPFRAWYADRLAELTFNSRPIIQNLSIEAMKQRDVNNWAGMQAITEEIELATMRAPPQGKLPLLYLIDSISKNVGSPYTDQLLPAIMPRLYIRTYREVDGVTKAKMEEMLKLWRNGGAYGGDLYAPGVREAVERDIFGSTPQLTQGSVQATLREYLHEKEEEMAREFTTQRAKRVNVLVQIDQLLSTTVVSPNELAEISEKIKNMKAGIDTAPQASASASVPASASAPVRLQQQRTQQPNFTPPSAPAYPPHPPPQRQVTAYPPPSFSAPVPQQAYPVYSGYPPSSLSAPALSKSIPAPVPVPAPPAHAPLAALSINVADILRNLNSSGLISQTQTPEPAPAKLKSALDTYEDMVLGMDLRVDVFDLSKLSLPTSHLPVRCKQCGMRFPDGENKLQAHMDWHFRRNRKERETEGRGAHRRWLPRAEEWINESTEAGPSSPKQSSSSLTSAGAGAGGGPGSGTNLPPKLSAERLAALARRWVRAPSDPVKAARPCPICKEQFKSEWSEDEEEWVFMNAVDINGQIYHATCRAEKMSAAVTARLLGTTEATGARSPATTPAPELAAAAAPGTPDPSSSSDITAVLLSPGKKRKANSDSGAGLGLGLGVGDTDDDDGVKRVKVEPVDEPPTEVAIITEPDQGGGGVVDTDNSGVNGDNLSEEDAEMAAVSSDVIPHHE